MSLGTEKRRAFAREVFSKLLATRSQRQLAAELGIDQSSVSTAKITGSIGFDSLRKAAKLAGYTEAQLASAFEPETAPPADFAPRKSEAVKALFATLLQGMTQEELAAKLGVDQSAVSKAKTMGRMGNESLRKAADIVGIRGPDYIEMFYGQSISDTLNRRAETTALNDALRERKLAASNAFAAVAREAQDAGASPVVARLVATAVTEWGLQDVPIVPEAVAEFDRARRYLESRAEVIRVRSALGGKKSTE